MKLLVIRPQAQMDVREIWEWIAKDNEPAADRVEAAIYSKIEKLARIPNIGHPRADVPNQSYLFVNVYSYAICYKYDDEFLTIVRVLHVSRDFPTLFGDPKND